MRSIITLLFLAVHFVSTAQINSETLRKQQFNTKDSWALDGYDPVSYFSGKPQKGDKKLFLSYLGIKYAFANTVDLNAFKQAPAKYEPQYGGWCAYAMGSAGEKVEIDPDTYKIVDGKLYLFFHSWTNNTLTKWNKNESALKMSADKNWLKFYK